MAKYCVANIREYFGEQRKERYLGETISDFLSPLNLDVEHFLKDGAIDFTKKSQSVTYLVFSAEDGELLGYFAIAVKPLTIGADKVSQSLRKRLERVSRLDETTQTYTMAAYLIAQLSKNFTGGANERISGGELLGLAWKVIESLQYAAGGVVAFVETENCEELLEFYQRNLFRPFGKRSTEGAHELIQLLRIIK